MIAKTGFPQYLESIAIGTGPEFLEKRTDLCEVANDFPQEVNLTYLWKQVGTSTEPIKEMKQFAKHFMLDGPDLDPEFIMHYTDKVKMMNPWLATQLTRDVQAALDKAEREAPNNRGIIYDDPKEEIASRDFDREKDLPNDPNFMDKLANLMNSCKAPGNYFIPISDKIGTIFDFNRINSIGAGLVDDVDLDSPPPIGIGSNIINKIAAPVQDVLFSAYTGAKLIANATKSVFMSESERQAIAKLNKSGIGADRGGAVPIGATSTSLFQDAMILNSKMMSKVRKNLKDNFRIYDHLNRYNAFDTQMNLAQANRRALKVLMRTPYSGDKEVPVQLTPQGVAAGSGSELKENNVTPRQALAPCVTGDSKRFDDTRSSNKTTYTSTASNVTGENSKKISDAAKSMQGVSTKNIPGTQNGVLGCATAVSMIYKQATGEDILPGRPIVLGTSELYSGLSNDSRFETVDVGNIQPGDILVTARGEKPGHTAVVTEDNMLVDNNSNTGSITRKSSVQYYLDTVVPRNPTQFKVFRRK